MKSQSFFIALIFCSNFLFSQNYCDYNNCLFWEQQPETVLGDTVVYAANQWSIDEWDNSLGCAFFDQCESLRLEVYYPDLPASVMWPPPLTIGSAKGAIATLSIGETYLKNIDEDDYLG